MVKMTGDVIGGDYDIIPGFVGEVSGCLDGIVAGGLVVLGFLVGRLRFGFDEVVSGSVVG